MKMSISIRNKYGKYKQFSKEFNNERHYNNWFAMMVRNGNKIIGTETI